MRNPLRFAKSNPPLAVALAALGVAITAGVLSVASLVTTGDADVGGNARVHGTVTTGDVLDAKPAGCAYDGGPCWDAGAPTAINGVIASPAGTSLVLAPAGTPEATVSGAGVSVVHALSGANVTATSGDVQSGDDLLCGDDLTMSGADPVVSSTIGQLILDGKTGVVLRHNGTMAWTCADGANCTAAGAVSGQSVTATAGSFYGASTGAGLGYNGNLWVQATSSVFGPVANAARALGANGTAWGTAWLGDVNSSGDVTALGADYIGDGTTVALGYNGSRAWTCTASGCTAAGDLAVNGATSADITSTTAATTVFANSGVTSIGIGWNGSTTTTVNGALTATGNVTAGSSRYYGAGTSYLNMASNEMTFYIGASPIMDCTGGNCAFVRVSSNGYLSAGAGISEGHAPCWKNGILSYCTSVVASDGTCTCAVTP